jgi:peptidyl-tRNA hydrolase, PTH1 family
MNKFVLLGLGNPGEEFTHTRHNLGVDILALWIEYMSAQSADISDFKTHEKFHARVCDVTYGDTAVSVLFPLVFMNESGKTLASYLRYHPIERESILVVHDDLELPLGETKIQVTGSAHGHNGVRSIHEYLGDTEVPQLRIGIGRPVNAVPVDKFVLSTFSPEEKRILQQKQQEIIRVIFDAVFQGG